MSLQHHIDYIEQDIQNKRNTHENSVWIGACTTMDQMFHGIMDDNHVEGYVNNSNGDMVLMKNVFEHFHSKNYKIQVVQEVIPTMSPAPMFSTLLTWD